MHMRSTLFRMAGKGSMPGVQLLHESVESIVLGEAFSRNMPALDHHHLLTEGLHGTC